MPAFFCDGVDGNHVGRDVEVLWHLVRWWCFLRHNTGSKHRTGRADDFQIRGSAPTAVTALYSNASTTARTPPLGGKLPNRSWPSAEFKLGVSHTMRPRGGRVVENTLKPLRRTPRGNNDASPGIALIHPFCDSVLRSCVTSRGAWLPAEAEQVPACAPRQRKKGTRCCGPPSILRGSLPEPDEGRRGE